MTDGGRPQHYGGADNPYETIKVLEAWHPLMALGFCWGNVIKYPSRLGRKDDPLKEAEKTATYARFMQEILERHPELKELLK